MSLRLRILLALLAALGLPLCAILWLALPRNPAQVKDPAYHFALAKLTHGTNHVVVLRNSLLAKLNTRLRIAGGRTAALNQDQAFSKTTPTKATLLWLAYTHDGELVGISPSGMPFPDLSTFEVCVSGPDGQRMRLRSVGGSYNPASGIYVTILAVPASVTNLSKCELRFPDGRPLGTLRVW